MAWTGLAPLLALLLALGQGCAAHEAELQQQHSSAGPGHVLPLLLQLASTMGSLQSQLSSYRDDLAAQKAQTASLESQLLELREKVDEGSKPVYFTAHMASGDATIGVSPVVFSKVVTKAGDGYNPSTGVFTAPVNGYYVFYAQLKKWYNHPGSIHWGIYSAAASRFLCSTTVELATDFDTASCLATVLLQKGDAVFVRRISTPGVTGNRLHGDVWSSFTGFLSTVEGA